MQLADTFPSPIPLFCCDYVIEGFEIEFWSSLTPNLNDFPEEARFASPIKSDSIRKKRAVRRVLFLFVLGILPLPTEPAKNLVYYKIVKFFIPRLVFYPIQLLTNTAQF